MKRTSLYTVGALVMIAGSAGIYTSQPSPMAERVQELENELRQIRQEHTALKAEHDKLKTTALAAEKKADALAEAAEKTAATSAGGGMRSDPQVTAASGGNTDTKRNFDLAAYHEKRVQTEIGQIDITYGKLIKDFGLAGPELESFRHLLKERLTIQGENMAKMTQPGLSKEERNALSKEMTASRKKSDEAIRHFLNNEEDFKAFQIWENSKGERGLVQIAMGSFDSAGASLTLEQRDQLMGLMADIRQERSSKPVKRSTPSPTAAQIATGEYELDAGYLQRAAAFLNPEQLEILKHTSLKIIFKRY
ncbi:hypothetical protein WJU23_22330 [Prosthecobacter sp. SYSU 5D2]|uniref:hypothetical protein n=1 Tax=Prosthecobacter sp. SYSU 5D2 TaxID=3134134 RepID=UPI0031FF24B3